MTHDDSTPDNLDLSIYLSIYRTLYNKLAHYSYIHTIHTGTIQAITFLSFLFAMEKWVDIYYPHRMVDLLFAYRNDKIPIML